MVCEIVFCQVNSCSKFDLPLHVSWWKYCRKIFAASVTDLLSCDVQFHHWIFKMEYPRLLSTIQPQDARDDVGTWILDYIGGGYLHQYEWFSLRWYWLIEQCLSCLFLWIMKERLDYFIRNNLLCLEYELAVTKFWPLLVCLLKIFPVIWGNLFTFSKKSIDRD